jgi:tRNA-dihydrouridine synthase
VPVLSNGNVRETDNIVDNLLATGAEGIMVAEHLLRDPGVFRRAGFEVNGGAATAPGGRKALAEAYVCLVEEVAGLSEAPLMLEDGSRPVRRGDKAPRVVEEEGEEFERHSVWWANVEVVKSHLGSILGGAGGLMSRSTFRNAASVEAVIRCFRSRFQLLHGQPHKLTGEG